MARWIATTTGKLVDPGTMVRVTGGSGSRPMSGDTFVFDGPGEADGDGVVAAVDERQLLVDIKGGVRFAFRPRHEGEKPSATIDDGGTDWVLLMVSPGGTA